MRKIIKTIITTIVAVTLTLTATAQDQNEYVVTASYLNIRQEPSAQSNIIGGMAKGSIITSNGTTNGWTAITYNSHIGYVFSRYLSPRSVSENNKEKSVKAYTNDELNLLARVVNSEAGDYRMTDEHQRAVASVVLNRVADSRFPNTIHAVVYQRGQYECAWNGMINIPPTQRAIDNARYVLENGVTIPKNVIFQALFKQGKGVWKYIQGHYFCY